MANEKIGGIATMDVRDYIKHGAEAVSALNITAPVPPPAPATTPAPTPPPSSTGTGK
jgi:hypothetical protein